MKRKASIAALDDLYESILKETLLGGLSREDKKLSSTKTDSSDLEIEEEDEEDSSNETDSEDMDSEEVSPKIIEFSVSRLGKLPNSSKKESKIDEKGGVNALFSSVKKRSHHKKRK